jgi:hypothetical protein
VIARSLIVVGVPDHFPGQRGDSFVCSLSIEEPGDIGGVSPVGFRAAPGGTVRRPSTRVPTAGNRLDATVCRSATVKAPGRRTVPEAPMPPPLSSDHPKGSIRTLKDKRIKI